MMAFTCIVVMIVNQKVFIWRLYYAFKKYSRGKGCHSGVRLGH